MPISTATGFHWTDMVPLSLPQPLDMDTQRKTSTSHAPPPAAFGSAYPANATEETPPRFNRFAEQRIGKWRRQQALITAIEVLFVVGVVTAWVLLR